MQADQLMSVPTDPIQPGCNPDSIFASTQCKGAWEQYQNAVQARKDVIQHNALVQARLAGQEEARQATNQILQQHDTEIARLQAQISALAAEKPTLFWKGAAAGATSALALCLLVVFAWRLLSKVRITRRETKHDASA